MKKNLKSVTKYIWIITFIVLLTLVACVSTSDPKFPVASFTADKISGNAPLTVSFDASASNDPDGNITKYGWDFGDGKKGNKVKTNHTYQNAGNYTVTLTVTDNSGKTNTATKTITVNVAVVPGSPLASFTADKMSGNAPLKVSFDASASNDPDGNITKYDWDFDDGTKGNGVNLNHTYQQDGIYTVTLTVTDDDSKTNTATKTITVGNSPSQCNVQASSDGDPHIRTFDRLGYDFQAAGEFVLVSSSQNDLTMHVRQEPFGTSKTVSVNTALSANVAGDRVGIYVLQGNKLVVNGNPTNITTSPFNLPNGGKIYKSGDIYTVFWPDNSCLWIKLHSTWANIRVALNNQHKDKITGLLGNYNSNVNDDLISRDGSLQLNLNPRPSFEQFYKQFGESWRISQAESLFDYEDAEDTNTFTDRNFPEKIVTSNDLSNDARQKAKQICEAASITDSILLEACILDVGLTGDSEFTDGHNNVIPPSEEIKPNKPPVARNDKASTTEHKPIAINVLKNDSDDQNDIDVSKVTVTKQPTHGTTAVNANGTITYSPEDGYADPNSPDTFKYTVRDGTGATSNQATVSVTVNQPPVDDVPLVGVIPGTFSTNGGTFDITVSPKDVNGELITGGVTLSNFSFRNISVATTSNPNTVVTTGTANPTKIEIITPSSGQQVSLVLDFDSSGSIAGNDPQRLRVDAGKQIVDSIKPTDKVAILDFSVGTTPGLRVSRLLQDFTSDKDALKSAIDLVEQAGSSTPLYSSLIDAFKVLNDASAPNPAIVILTDGRANDGSLFNDVVNQAKAQSTPIFPIGLGTSPDFTELQDLARETGGTFGEANKPEDLQKVFDAIGVGLIQGRIKITGEGNFNPSLTSTGNHIVSGELVTTIGGQSVPTPFNFRVNIQ